jgi:hypothetical protein
LLRTPATTNSRVETVVDRFTPAVSARSAAGSLGADRDLRPLADAMDSIGADTAAFSTDVFRFAHDGGTLRPYRAIAVGAGVRSDGDFMAIALAEPDAAAALENANRLRTIVESGSGLNNRRRWSELLRPESIEARGRIVLALLPTSLPMLWLDLERNPDTLLWWSS